MHGLHTLTNTDKKKIKHITTLNHSRHQTFKAMERIVDEEDALFCMQILNLFKLIAYFTMLVIIILCSPCILPMTVAQKY